MTQREFANYRKLARINCPGITKDEVDYCWRFGVVASCVAGRVKDMRAEAEMYEGNAKAMATWKANAARQPLRPVRSRPRGRKALTSR